MLIASVIAALLYSPLSAMVGEAHHPRLAYSVGGAYLLLSLLWLVIGRNERWLRQIVVGGVLLDIVAASLLAHALPGASAGISMSLLFNIAAAATLLPLSWGLVLALAASVATAANHDRPQPAFVAADHQPQQGKQQIGGADRIGQARVVGFADHGRQRAVEQGGDDRGDQHPVQREEIQLAPRYRFDAVDQ